MRAIIPLFQRTLLAPLDAKLVRASWLDRFVEETRSRYEEMRSRYEQENAEGGAIRQQLQLEFEAATARFARTQADLASAHRQLLSRHDALTDAHQRLQTELESMTVRCVRAEAGHAALTDAHQKLQTELKSMTAQCARAEAGHAALTDAHQKLQTELESMTARCARAETGHAALADAFRQLQSDFNRTAESLTEAVNGSVRNFLYAADLKAAPAEETSEGIRELARLLRPQEAVGRSKVRLGGANDGGYVMLDDFETTTTAFSLGVGNDVSWDLGLAHRGIQVHLFDHTIAELPMWHSHLHFHRRRIAAIASSESEDLRSMLRFADDGTPMSNPILKIDIEHDEWDILDRAAPELLRSYSQIICEFHWLGRAISREWLTKARCVLKKMNNDFQVIHVHGNNCAPYSLIAGLPMPSVLEVTYCNRRNYEFHDTSELFPGQLDAPNNPAAPDLVLGSFRF